MTATKTIAAALIAATLGTTAGAIPASAGGSVSVNVAPRTQQEADAMRFGLGLYSLYNDVKSGASVKQRGSNNTAGVAQHGRNNNGIVYQEGNGHTGTIRQNGNNNSYGLFQFGRGTSANVSQNGNGQSGMTFQWGW